MTHVLNAAGWAVLSFWVVLIALPPHGKDLKKMPDAEWARLARSQITVSAFIAVSIFLILL